MTNIPPLVTIGSTLRDPALAVDQVSWVRTSGPLNAANVCPGAPFAYVAPDSELNQSGPDSAESGPSYGSVNEIFFVQIFFELLSKMKDCFVRLGRTTCGCFTLCL